MVKGHFVYVTSFDLTSVQFRTQRDKELQTKARLGTIQADEQGSLFDLQIVHRSIKH